MPSEPLTQIQNDFTEMSLTVPSTKLHKLNKMVVRAKNRFFLKTTSESLAQIQNSFTEMFHQTCTYVFSTEQNILATRAKNRTITFKPDPLNH